MTARDRKKNGRGLERKAETRSVKSTFRIYAEGKATEPEYISALRLLPDIRRCASIDIQIVKSGATPLHLVDSACRDKRLSGLDVDYYWCVFDVESPDPHPYLLEACQKAQANGVFLAISNPCFEVWLILHYQRHSRYISTDDAVRIRRRLDGSESKHLDFDAYAPLVSNAIEHAGWLRDKHKRDGTEFPEDNPSSSLDELVSQLFAAATLDGEASEAIAD